MKSCEVRQQNMLTEGKRGRNGILPGIEMAAPWIVP